jgi:protein involved in polysaccharide export with SLBB domain
LKTRLDSAYAPYLKFASTNVKLANLRVTILGEVENPGVHYFFNNQTTILEAISLAGDFTDFGNRKKVKLIRRYGNETKGHSGSQQTGLYRYRVLLHSPKRSDLYRAYQGERV